MLDNLFKKREARRDAVAKAREEFISWKEISESNGWKAYQEVLDKKVENILNKIQNNIEMTGEDLKGYSYHYRYIKRYKGYPGNWKITQGEG